MDVLRWGRNPWGQWVLTHVSWSLFWAALFAGVLFFVAHASYMLFSAHRKRASSETDALEAKYKNLPPKIERHSLVARLFHWVMAASMFTLLFTAFLPIAGIRFPWVQWHWIAGIVLIASIVFHIFHATFFLDFWSIWIGPKDIPEMKADLLREFGQDVPGPKSGKYPIGNRLYHLAIVFAGLGASITGALMIPRIRTGIVTRNPYYLSDFVWGITYVTHGLAGVGLVGLVIAHVYFAIRPEKLWITKAMIFGYITRRQYLEHHEPSRWVVAPDGSSKSAGPV
ncbi:MAG TPA: cytochrome b/b6 domain-containing protein [Vicinamibacterales bacterium]